MTINVPLPKPSSESFAVCTNAPLHAARVCLNSLRICFLAPPGRSAVGRPADVEGCFGILFSLLYKTDNPKAAMPGLSMEIATKVLEKIDDRAPLRLKL